MDEESSVPTPSQRVPEGCEGGRDKHMKMASELYG